MCACTDVKEDSSSVVSPLDAFGVYLHLPYVAPTGFLFRQAEERDHFLSALKTCIRHSNLGKLENNSLGYLKPELMLFAI